MFVVTSKKNINKNEQYYNIMFISYTKAQTPH